MLLLDTQLPWTQDIFEAVSDAVGSARLSDTEPSATAIAAMVRMLAGEINHEQALQAIVQQYLPEGAGES